MNIKTLVFLSILVAIGAVLHAVIPGFFLGMKPDMMLVMMFLGIILFPEKKNVLVLGIVTGFISGLTSSFPGGFIPNIIDKFFTAFLFFALLQITKQSKSLIKYGIITALGTLISGFIFLGSAFLIVGLPGGFLVLFSAVVLPATVLNTMVLVIIYPMVNKILLRARAI